MSRRRKHVTLGMRDDACDLAEGISLARVVDSRGGNILEVAFASGRQTLCMIPSRFKNKLWVRKGGFVMVEEYEEAAGDTKVTGTITKILYDEQIKELKRTPGVWPPEFDIPLGGAATPAVATFTSRGAGSEGSAEEEGPRAAAAGISAAGEVAASCLSDSLTALDMERGETRGAAAAAARPCRSSEAEARCGALGNEGTVAASVSGDVGEHHTREEYEGEEEEDDDDKLPLYENPNRRFVQHEEVSDSSSDNEGGP